MESSKEKVNHPPHYNNYEIEVIEMMRKIFGDYQVEIYCKLNAFKCRMRMGLMEGNPMEQDFNKEQWYLDYKNKLKNK
mgnify:CR=1 FL=1